MSKGLRRFGSPIVSLTAIALRSWVRLSSGFTSGRGHQPNRCPFFLVSGTAAGLQRDEREISLALYVLTYSAFERRAAGRREIMESAGCGRRSPSSSG